MDVTRFLFEFVVTVAAIGVPIGLAARWFDRGSNSIEPLDASAASLWPVVPEESEAPRWRIELIGHA